MISYFHPIKGYHLFAILAYTINVSSLIPVHFSVLLFFFSHRNVRVGPEMAEISDPEVDTEAHLRGHNHDGHVPAQRSNDEQQSAASLPAR